MKLRWLVLASALCSGWQGRAAACSVVLPQQQSLACGASAGAGSHTSVAAARLELDAVEIQRSRYAPPGLGDCGELGSTRLRFHLAGSSTWPADVGLLLTLREGQSGYFAPPLTTVAGTAGWLLLPQAGAVRLFGPDDPRVPLALRLEARAVDCAGAVSAPLDVNITHPGRSDAGPPEPEAAPTTPVVPQGAAGSAATDAAVPPASRPAPGASCAVCSVTSRARGSQGGGLWLAVGALALGVLRRRR